METQEMIEDLLDGLIINGHKNAYAHLAVELNCSETWVRGLCSGEKTPGRHFEMFIREYYKNRK